MTPIKASPEDIAKLADTVSDEVAQILHDAARIPTLFEDIEGDLYTSVHPSFATVYSIAVEYVQQQVRGNLETFGTVAERLRAGADSWQRCEEANTFPDFD